MPTAMDLSATLSGGKELAAALEQLSTKMDRKIVRAALKEAAQPILEAARSHVPTLTGLLASEIRVKVGVKRGNPYARIQVGALGFYKGHAFYGAFIEFGHLSGSRAQHYTFRDRQGRFSRSSSGAIQAIGRHPIAARPFMRPAFDQQHENALDIFMDVTRRGVTDALSGLKVSG